MFSHLIFAKKTAMEHYSLYRDIDDYYRLLTFKREEILKLCELSIDDFGPYLTDEQWKSVLKDESLIVNSRRDEHTIYLLQLGSADIIAPIKKGFMKVYVGIQKNIGQKSYTL